MRAVVLSLFAIWVALWNSAAFAQKVVRIDVEVASGEAHRTTISKHVARYVRQSTPQLKQALGTHKLSARVVVGIIAKPDGRVTHAFVDKGSGYPALDKIAVQAVRRASPLPVGATRSSAKLLAFSLPIQFQ